MLSFAEERFFSLPTFVEVVEMKKRDRDPHFRSRVRRVKTRDRLNREAKGAFFLEEKFKVFTILLLQSDHS